MVCVCGAFEGVPLSQVRRQAASDPNLAKYRQIREKAASPKALHDLAHWCDKQGWHDRARLQYAQVLADARSDAAARQEAVRKLDIVPVGGAWLTKAEVQARQERVRSVEQ